MRTTIGGLSDSRASWHIVHYATDFVPPKWTNKGYSMSPLYQYNELLVYKYRVKYENGLTDAVSEGRRLLKSRMQKGRQKVKAKV